MTPPTPWRVGVDTGAGLYDAEGGYLGAIVDHNAAALVLRAVNQHEARIGAACEMYGALTQPIEVAGGYAATSCFSPEPVLLVAALARAKAAMVQAESIGRDCA